MESSPAQLVAAAPPLIEARLATGGAGPLLGQHPDRRPSDNAGVFRLAAKVGLDPFAVLRVHTKTYAQSMEMNDAWPGVTIRRPVSREPRRERYRAPESCRSRAGRPERRRA